MAEAAALGARGRSGGTAVSRLVAPLMAAGAAGKWDGGLAGLRRMANAMAREAAGESGTIGRMREGA